MVYKEVLALPDGLVRSFAPPALLQTNTLFRAEAMPIFYSENHFEITIKRSPEDKIWAADRYVPHLDKTVWQRFLRMWDVFNVYGSNCLHYIRRITLIYQLSMDNGFDFGDNIVGGIYDKRLGFRFSADPFEEDLDGSYGEESDAESGSDSSDDEFDLDFEQLEAEADNLEAEDSTSSGYEYEADTDVEEIPAEDIDPVGVFELNRGIFDWPSRHKTRFFLWHRMGEYGKETKVFCKGAQKANQCYTTTQSLTTPGPCTPSTGSPTCCGVAPGTAPWHRTMRISSVMTYSTGWQATPASDATTRTTGYITTRMMSIYGNGKDDLSHDLAEWWYRDGDTGVSECKGQRSWTQISWAEAISRSILL